MEKLSQAEYLRYHGDFDILKLQSRLHLNIEDIKCKTNLEAVNYVQTLNGLRAIKEGNEEILYKGVNYITSFAYNLELNVNMVKRITMEHYKILEINLHQKWNNFYNNKLNYLNLNNRNNTENIISL